MNVVKDVPLPDEELVSEFRGPDGVGRTWLVVIPGYPASRIIYGLHPNGGFCPTASLEEVQDGLVEAGHLQRGPGIHFPSSDESEDGSEPKAQSSDAMMPPTGVGDRRLRDYPLFCRRQSAL